jgi:hypothetical protein
VIVRSPIRLPFAYGHHHEAFWLFWLVAHRLPFVGCLRRFRGRLLQLT